MAKAGAAEIDRYIARQPAKIRAILRKVRATIRAAAPAAEEVISYQMPAFKHQGIVVFFAAWKEHLGLYPPVSGDDALERALAPYAGPKGNLRFPFDQPIPYDLIGRVVTLRVQQNEAKAQAKVAAKRSKKRG